VSFLVFILDYVLVLSSPQNGIYELWGSADGPFGVVSTYVRHRSRRECLSAHSKAIVRIQTKLIKMYDCKLILRGEALVNTGSKYR
jgi:hypothetical protein